MKKKSKNNGLNTSQAVFDNITANAIDYLKNSIDEFETKPKYSLIHFITALELFLKARLFKEHWTLLLTNIDKEDIDKFMDCDSLTVDFKKANNRLKTILEQPLDSKEFECFDKLRKHRNKLIHFYNKDYSGKSKKVKSQVLYELSEGWYYLHRLLTTKWKIEFKDYLRDIEAINKKILRNKKFWQGKFNALKDGIILEKKKGTIFQGCFICGFEAVKLTEITGYYHYGQCLICNDTTYFLEIKCPNEDCAKVNYLTESYDYCHHCQEVGFTPDYIRKTYEPPRSLKDIMSGDYSVYCPECSEDDPTVIEFGENFLCVSCLEFFETILYSEGLKVDSD